MYGLQKAARVGAVFRQRVLSYREVRAAQGMLSSTSQQYTGSGRFGRTDGRSDIRVVYRFVQDQQEQVKVKQVETKSEGDAVFDGETKR